MIVVASTGEKSVVFMLGEKLVEIEEQVVEIVLENNNYNRTKAAKALGFNRTTLQMRLKNRYPNLYARIKEMKCPASS